MNDLFIGGAGYGGPVFVGALEYLHKNNFHILLIGHRNHPEVIGTMGQLPQGSIKLIETVSDVEFLNANTFKVSDIEISSPFDLNFKKNLVIDKGFQSSFSNLLRYLRFLSMLVCTSTKTKPLCDDFLTALIYSSESMTTIISNRDLLTNFIVLFSFNPKCNFA